MAGMTHMSDIIVSNCHITLLVYVNVDGLNA